MGALPIITATKVSRQAQEPACWAPFAPAYILSVWGLEEGLFRWDEEERLETYGDDEHAAQYTSGHDENPTGEEN
jgi:hypothetical protein